MMKRYNQTTKTPESELRCFIYVSEYNGSPKPGFISSRPSTGGEFVNMYGLTSDRKHLIETNDGYLMGICSKTNKLCKFNIIDDTYIVQIPSIIKLKAEIDKIPNVPFNPKNLWKYRFNQKKLNKNEY
jgi:hypothetical protein